MIIIDSVKVGGREYKRNWRERLSDKLHDAADWIRDNQETVVALTPVVTAGIAGVVKIMRGIVKLRIAGKEYKVTNRRCYDPSEGHYWTLRKTPTNSEWLEVSKRLAAGEKLGYILADMKLLKR